MESSQNQEKKSRKCCICPYTHVQKTFDNCCIGCDKPGIGSPEHNPGDNSCSDCSLICCPCALVIDILCIIPMCFGLYTVKNPND